MERIGAKVDAATLLEKFITNMQRERSEVAFNHHSFVFRPRENPFNLYSNGFYSSQKTFIVKPFSSLHFSVAPPSSSGGGSTIPLHKRLRVSTDGGTSMGLSPTWGGGGNGM